MTEHGRNYNTDLFRCDQAISHLMHPDQIERAIDHRLEEAASTFRRSGDEYIFNDAAIRELFRAGEAMDARLPEIDEMQDASHTIANLSEDLDVAQSQVNHRDDEIADLKEQLEQSAEEIAGLNERIGELEEKLADASE